MLDPTVSAAAAIGEIVHYNLFETLTKITPEGTVLPLLAPRGEMMVARAEDFAALDDYLRDAREIEELTTEQALILCPILRPEAALRLGSWRCNQICYPKR